MQNLQNDENSDKSLHNTVSESLGGLYEESENYNLKNNDTIKNDNDEPRTLEHDKIYSKTIKIEELVN